MPLLQLHVQYFKIFFRKQILLFEDQWLKINGCVFLYSFVNRWISLVSNYHVVAYYNGTETDLTGGFVTTEKCQTGQYGKVRVNQLVDQVS